MIPAGRNLSQVRNDSFGGGDVPAHAAKRLREGAHQNVDVVCWHPKMLTDTPSSATHGTNRVCLVQVQIRLVLFSNGHDFRKPADLSLHGVDPFDANEDLGPGSVGPRLPFSDRVAKQFCEVLRVIVLEHLDLGAGRTRPSNNRGMVEAVTDNQSTLADQSGQNCGVGCKAHSKYHSSRLAQKICDFGLQFEVRSVGAKLSTRTGRSHTMCFQCSQGPLSYI
mmetsp:Transcript_35207/g.80348  ORF Transcript_35207/g.80348 Transcript_35207/m.80348 type:complete len:222 (+) Transcript_35207:659-1324(+)